MVEENKEINDKINLTGFLSSLYKGERNENVVIIKTT